MYALRVAFCVIALTGCALSQSDNTLDIDKVKQNLPNLNIDESSLPDKEEVEKVLREKCDKNGGAGTFDDIVKSKDNVQECLTNHINQTQVMAELEEAKKDGSMDDVFGKYCKKREKILTCVTDVTDKIEKCLEPTEKDNMRQVLNITQNLIDFLCYKDGDRLAMFVAEGGFECLEKHKDALQECANKTLSSRIPKDLSIHNLPMFTFTGDSQCADMIELQKCAVLELEKCENNTPANIVEALFKFIKKVSPCKDYKPAAAPQQQRKSRTAEMALAAAHNHNQAAPEEVQESSPIASQIIGNKVKRSQSMDFTSVDNFRDKCNKYSGPSAFKELSMSVNETKLCIQTLLRQPNACELLLTDGKRCVGRTVNKLRVCLPPQESYLPAFLIASVDNGLDYLCKHNGQNFNRFLHGLPCMISSQYGDELGTCMASNKIRRTSDNPIVTKGELCEDMDRIKSCLSTYVTNRCSQMQHLKEVSMGLMEAVKDPCAGCSIYSNTMLLVSALAFYYLTRNSAYISE